MTDVNIRRESSAVTADDLRLLLQPQKSPCVSIYVHTAPAGNADQGRIRFKSAVQQVQRDLETKRQPGQEGDYLDPLRALGDDAAFWRSQSHGLAVFFNPEFGLQLRRLPEPLRDDLVVVADSFHIKPLIRIAQHMARFQVLAIASDKVALYEGDFQRLTPVELHPEVPRNMEEALGAPNHVAKVKRARQDPEDSDSRDRQLQRYFRRVDEAITRYHSEPAGLPLILAALKQYHGFFHEASHNPHLVEGGIERDPFHEITPDDLAQHAWQILAPLREARLADLREKFGTGKAHNGATDQINEVARQAVFGKVATLLLREDHRVGGTVDRGTGEITFRAIGNPHTDDVLDDIAEIVLGNGGEVFVLPADQTIGDTGVAAIYRYATP